MSVTSFGKIFVSASGGTPPLSVSLDARPDTFTGPATVDAPLNGWHVPPYTFEDLNTGSYRVFIQDVTGCVQSELYILSESQYPTLSFHATDVTCYGERNGSITGSVEGGIPPYTFSFTDPDGQTTVQNTSPNAYFLQTGSYLIRVDDAIGCDIQQTFVISSPPLLSFTASANYDDAYSSSVNFDNVVSGPNARFYLNEYDKDPTNLNNRANVIANYSSSQNVIAVPPKNNNAIRGGWFGAYMEVLSDVANVTCSTDIQYIEIDEREWRYRLSSCEEVSATSNPYRIINFYRARNLLFDGTIPRNFEGDLITNDFLDGLPLDGLNIQIFTGSADEVNYDPSNPTRDKLISEFNTSGSLSFTGSFSYITNEDLIVVLKNAETNTRFVNKVLKKFPGYRKDGQDITSSLIVTSSMLSGSDDNYVQSPYFGNVGATGNTGSMIITMSKVNDEIAATEINIEIASLYAVVPNE